MSRKGTVPVQRYCPPILRAKMRESKTVNNSDTDMWDTSAVPKVAPSVAFISESGRKCIGRAFREVSRYRTPSPEQNPQNNRLKRRRALEEPCGGSRGMRDRMPERGPLFDNGWAAQTDATPAGRCSSPVPGAPTCAVNPYEYHTVVADVDAVNSVHSPAGVLPKRMKGLLASCAAENAAADRRRQQLRAHTRGRGMGFGNGEGVPGTGFSGPPRGDSAPGPPPRRVFRDWYTPMPMPMPQGNMRMMIPCNLPQTHSVHVPHPSRLPVAGSFGYPSGPSSQRWDSGTMSAAGEPGSWGQGVIPPPLGGAPPSMGEVPEDNRPAPNSSPPPSHSAFSGSDSSRSSYRSSYSGSSYSGSSYSSSSRSSRSSSAASR